MKRANIFLIVILFAITIESIGQRQAVNNDLITVDVRKTYSQKKELIIQDFMDVEYVALETKDGFFNQGIVQDVGKEFILVTNITRDGVIFVYDRAGKALSTIKHQGQGPEEYVRIFNIALDEDNGEIFVNDIYGDKIVVYDLFGKFKRNFKHKQGGGSVSYTEVFNYDKRNLICYDQQNKEIAFVLVSKQDGSITKEVKVPFKEKKLLMQVVGDGYSSPGFYPSIYPYKGKWILSEISSDTVYSFLPDKSLQPFIVRTPSVQSMNPEVMLILRFISERYYFMEAIKNEYKFPRTYFMYDKQEKVFFSYVVYNGDYSSKELLSMSLFKPVNHEMLWRTLEAHELVVYYKNGKLKDGKLKEIASKLDEEDNPVIMLIKHKK